VLKKHYVEIVQAAIATNGSKRTGNTGFEKEQLVFKLPLSTIYIFF